MFANFLNARQGPETLAVYNDALRKPKRNAGLALFVVCHNDHARLRHLESYAHFYIDRFYSGNSQAIKTEAFSRTNGQSTLDASTRQYHKGLISGSFSELKEQLQAMAEESQANPLLLIPWAERLEERREMIALLGALNAVNA